MVISERNGQSLCYISLNGDKSESVDEFLFGVMMSKDVSGDGDVELGIYSSPAGQGGQLQGR